MDENVDVRAMTIPELPIASHTETLEERSIDPLYSTTFETATHLNFLTLKRENWGTTTILHDAKFERSARTAAFSATARKCGVSGSDHVIRERTTARAILASSRGVSPPGSTSREGGTLVIPLSP